MKPHKSITSSSKTNLKEFKKEHETPSAPSSEDKGEIERELAKVTFEDLQEALFDGSYFVDHHWSSV
ncbi:hypothetical protein ACOSQ4_028230 [Xanthoceras sorbifolium]